jgi:hypothetical protein
MISFSPHLPVRARQREMELMAGYLRDLALIYRDLGPEVFRL